MAARSQVLSVYRRYLRAGISYQDYNFKHYILRRATTEFRQNKVSPNKPVRAAAAKMADNAVAVRMTVCVLWQDVTDETTLRKLWEAAVQNLAIVERQSTISRLFATDSKNILQQQKGSSK